MDAERNAKDIIIWLIGLQQTQDLCESEGVVRTLKDKIKEAIIQAHAEGIKDERDESREKLAKSMLEMTLATGHGDTIEDLLEELKWQVAELRSKKPEKK